MGALDRVRYDCDGINRSYFGGDTASWQRYTYDMPIGTLTRDGQTVSILLDKALEMDTWYALVLLHGNHEEAPKGSGKAIYDDYLIPFKTVANFVTLQISTGEVVGGVMPVLGTSLGGEPVGSSIEIHPHQTVATLRAEFAKRKGCDLGMVRLVLPDGSVLTELNDHQNLHAALLGVTSGDKWRRAETPEASATKEAESDAFNALLAMGFTVDSVKCALEVSAGDADRAVAMLLDSQTVLAQLRQ